MAQRATLLASGRSCAYVQVVFTAVIAAAATYGALATADDVARIGEPSLKGASVSGFTLLAVCAAVLSGLLFFAIRQAYGGTAHAWWAAIGCELILVGGLADTASVWLSGGVVVAVAWFIAVLLTLGAGVGLLSVRLTSGSGACGRTVG